MRFFKLALSIFLLAHAACAPKIETVKFKQSNPKFGPKQTDSVLQFNREYGKTEETETFWEREIDTVDYLNSAEDLIQAGINLKSDSLKNLGFRLSNSFYNSKGTTTEINIENSPFLEAAIKEVGPMIKERIADSVLLIKNEKGSLLEILSRIPPKKYTSPLSPSGLSSELEELLSFSARVIEASDLDPMIKNGIAFEINLKKLELLPKVQRLGEAIEKAEKFSDSLFSTQELLNVFNYVPDEETAAKLTVANRLAVLIDNLSSEQQALTIIIEFWKMMTDQERKQNIEATSKELYAFLNERNDRQLNCLASDSCSTLYLGLAKKKIFKEFKSIGLANLKTSFNSGAKEGLIKAVSEGATESLSRINETLALEIENGLNSKVIELEEIANNLRSFALEKLTKWAKENLFYKTGEESNVLRGAEYEKIKVVIKSKRISVLPISQSLETGPAALGSAMSLAGLRWMNTPLTDATNIEERNRGQMQNTLEQVNKMLALIGYSGPNSGSFPPYIISIGSDRAPVRFDSDDIFSRSTGAAVPDRIRLKNGYIPDGAISKNISVKSQAELLRGVSRVMKNFKDWETSIFDEGLGSVSIGELKINSLPEEIAQEPLFPKAPMFAMAIGNAALVLHNLSKDLSPIFVVDNKLELTWADELENRNNRTTVAAMAGIVDIVDGKRSTIVRTKDISRYILALVEFYSSTQGLENTKATLLNEVDSKSGKSPKELLIESRPRIKSLIIGLSNFLTHMMQDKDGGFISSFDLTEGKANNAHIKVLNDQILAIRALIASSQMLKTKFYAWSAVDSYFYMNQNLWNENEEFYKLTPTVQGTLFLNRIQSLNALAQLRPFLSVQSQKQLDRVLELNIQRLEEAI